MVMASGMSAWAGVFCQDGQHYAIGGSSRKQAVLLGAGDRMVCLAAADDWLNTNESDETAHKSRSWLHQPPTQKQLRWLPGSCRMDYSLTRYQASAMLSLKFNLSAIRACLANAAGTDTGLPDLEQRAA